MIYMVINKKVNLSDDNGYIKEKKLLEVKQMFYERNYFIMKFMYSYINLV